MPGQAVRGQSLKEKQEKRWRTVRQGQELEPSTEVANAWFPNATRNSGNREGELHRVEFKAGHGACQDRGLLPVLPSAHLWGLRYHRFSCMAQGDTSLGARWLSLQPSTLLAPGSLTLAWLRMSSPFLGYFLGKWCQFRNVQASQDPWWGQQPLS